MPCSKRLFLQVTRRRSRIAWQFKSFLPEAVYSWTLFARKQPQNGRGLAEHSTAEHAVQPSTLLKMNVRDAQKTEEASSVLLITNSERSTCVAARG